MTVSDSTLTLITDSPSQRRINDRLAKDVGVDATSRLVIDLTVAFDETIADLIREDCNGSALRAAGFTAVADTVYRVLEPEQPGPSTSPRQEAS